MEDEAKGKKKKPLDLDWKELFEIEDDGPPPELEVVGRKEHHNHKRQSFFQSERACLESMPDHELKEKICRIRGQLRDLAPKLPDKGAKLQLNFKLHEDEQDRRTRIRLQKDADQCQKSARSDSLNFGKCDQLSSDAAASQANSESTFSSLFSQKLEEKERICGNLQSTRTKGILPNNDREETKKSSKKSSFQCSTSCTVDKKYNRISNDDEKFISCSNFYLPNADGNSSSCFSKRRKASEVRTSVNLRNRKTQTVVLVDEEDCQPMQKTQQEDGPVGRKEAKIYYPSRDDPGCVELCHSDIECLAPEAFLSSTIMNFYIRYLQRPVSATGKSRSDYYFFNTYFYGKLKEAVSYKGDDKDTFYVKFRRWWKGVNIFRKAYILLPIHDNLHWSLAIICIPDEEDESGPIILHLDSLGYHSSSQIFQNVKSYLIEEWNYAKPQVVPSDLPIAEKIWKHLPRRIDGKTIKVPQQKNDYDCGIFVLYFMERFIEEAPQRLRKRDLSKFSSQWFRPEEASGLRERIRELLLEEFHNAVIENNSRELSPASSDDDSEGCNGYATDS